MNTIKLTKKIQLIVEVVEDVFEFLDLKLIFDREYKHILVNISAKATNTFTLKNIYLLHSSHDMLQIFYEKAANVTYRRNKKFKELKSPSLFLKL